MNGKPKCLVEIGDHTLIEYQLMLLRKVGIERICVVVGYEAEQVRSVLGNTCEYITNQRYAETNSLYSLWLTRDWVSGPFVLMNCDVLAHPEILDRVMQHEGNVLAYDSSSGDQDEHMKVSFDGNLLRRISKGLAQEESHGENVGILQFDKNGTKELFREVNALVRSGCENLWAPSALDRIVNTVPVRGVDIAGLSWTEIDFPEDLRYAQNRVWPSILDDIGVETLASTSFETVEIGFQDLLSSCYEFSGRVGLIWRSLFSTSIRLLGRLLGFLTIFLSQRSEPT